MFGYIRPFKPEMKVREYDVYKAIYCGLCKELGKSFGFMSRMTLSYDFVFLALIHMAVNDNVASLEESRCIAHPLKKSPMAITNEALSYTASCAVISIYYKLKDNLADDGLIQRIPAAGILPFSYGAFKKAAKDYPDLSKNIKDYVDAQRSIEQQNCTSIDMSAEPTALIMAQIAQGVTDDANFHEGLSRFGYLLGRWTYLIDALDDVRDDFKAKSYNPFLAGMGIDILDDEALSHIFDVAKGSINMTASELASCYADLDVKKYRPILDNIVYLGLKHTLNTILNKHDKNTGTEEINERSI